MYNAQNLVQNIKQQAKQKNILIGDMLLACELNKNTLSQISDKKGLSSFSLARIADYLDCSVDYLLGCTNDQSTNNISHSSVNVVRGDNSGTVTSSISTSIEEKKDLSKEEIGILDVYRSLDIRDRTKFMNFVFEMEDKINKE